LSRIKLQLRAWTLLTPNAWSPELVAVEVAVAVLVSDDVAVEELVAVAVAVDDSVYNHNLNHTSQAAITCLMRSSLFLLVPLKFSLFRPVAPASRH
jgi:hypothetical protein